MSIFGNDDMQMRYLNACEKIADSQNRLANSFEKFTDSFDSLVQFLISNSINKSPKRYFIRKLLLAMSRLR